MQLNREKVKELFLSKASGNYNKFAELTQIDVSILYKFLNGKANWGLKTINKFIDYCKNNSIDYTQYIF